MRRFCVGIAALLLSACGGEVYQVAPIEAFNTLSGIGTPAGLDPLPGGLSPVNVSFESVPANNTVQWLFTHEGDDIGRIVATVTPEGDTASNVSVAYIQGTAPDDRWRNAQARRLIQNQVTRVVTETVDAAFEQRPVSAELLADYRAQVTMASMSGLMNDVSASMDKEIERRDQAKRESESRSAANPYLASKPSTDLSKFNGSN